MEGQSQRFVKHVLMPEILKLVKERGVLYYKDVAADFCVSEATIKRYFIELSKQYPELVYEFGKLYLVKEAKRK